MQADEGQGKGNGCEEEIDILETSWELTVRGIEEKAQRVSSDLNIVSMRYLWDFKYYSFPFNVWLSFTLYTSINSNILFPISHNSIHVFCFQIEK